jgi:hypothetical protein
MSEIPVTPIIPLSYPATLSIDYPGRPLNRLTSFFRIIMVIPIAIILGLITTAMFQWDNGNTAQGWELSTAGFVVLPLILMILFRKKYPKWWFEWNLALTRFSYRVSAYILLLRDEYPSTDEEQAVHLDLFYPDAKTELMRGMPLIKWFLAIPHLIILVFLSFAAIICVIIAWFAILFTGRYPKGLFNFVVGVERWNLRVAAYMLLLITDKYPPFSLEA